MSTTLLEMTPSAASGAPELARRRRGSGEARRRPGRASAGRSPGAPPAPRRPTCPCSPSELLELLDPQPGQTAIDCTFGDGGHARLVAERLGAERDADRDRPRPAGRAALRRARRRDAPARCASSAPATPRLSNSSRRRDCGPTWPTSTSACPRCRSTHASAGSPTPTTRPWTCGWIPARSSPPASSWPSGTSAASPRRCATSARSATRARSPRRSSAPRARHRSRPPCELVDTINSAIPAPARFAGGHPAKRSFQALRIAVNDEFGPARAGAPACLGAAARGRRAGRHLLPLARGLVEQTKLERSTREHGWGGCWVTRNINGLVEHQRRGDQRRTRK